MMPDELPDGAPADSPAPVDYDADALVARLKRNAVASLAAVAVLVAAVWREPMPVVGALLGGGLVMLNFIFLERLATRLLGTSKPAANPVQLVLLAFRVGLMALMLYGIFALPGVHPVPVALGLSILVLAVLIESLSEVLPPSPPPA